MKRLVIGLAAVTLVAVACGGGTTKQSTSPAPVATVNPSGEHQPVTLTVWDYHSQQEGESYQKVIAGFTQKYPWITVNLVPGKQQPNFSQGINAGTPIDAAIICCPDLVAKYCSTGAMRDLQPYFEAYNIDVSKIILPASLKSTSYQGTQCMLPLLTDAYGLYYNKALFSQAGISGPPKTLSEFSSDAEKLTQLNPDGSIKVAGFVPLAAFYENANLYAGNPWGTQWYDSGGKSAFATDPAWTQMLQWQKALVDYYGIDKLRAFVAELGGANSEWSSAQGFEAGKIAMAFDGEWREAMIKNDGAPIDYGVAPFPAADDKPELYGSGQVQGTTIGIPVTAEHPNEAFLLVRYLALNTKAQEQLAELIGNIPTTFKSLKGTALNDDPIFKTFLDIFGNPDSGFRPITPLGTADADALTQFMGDWEAGKVQDLQAGLSQLASNIDQQAQLG